ncbi:serine protease (plasmid) [Sphingobium sp. SJ10-10]|uniref:trypsin-like serine peptidase n=1 Tax=Sphingobium sp. SJ10-10 TaxID=3114999 RepID=UPI002E18BD06
MSIPTDPTVIAQRAQRALQLIRSVGIDRVQASLQNTHEVATKAIVGGSLPEDIDPVRRSIAIGQRLLTNLDKEMPEAWGPDELQGLESIVVTVGRPALLIRSDRFDLPPPTWQVLEAYRDAIQANFASVGRIELAGHPSLSWVGTGFMVAPGVLATNRHVIQEFAQQRSPGHWIMDPGISARVDFAEEIGTIVPRESPVGGIIAVHNSLDVALLEVASSVAPALPLDGGGVPLGPGRTSYVIGYPALDSRRNDPAVMQSIFGNVYDVKRLQPGLLNDWSASMQAYLHDCSTLGGNSGSCLVDLATGVVTGVHFGGRYLENNWAISTRDLAGSGYLQKLGARFV